MLFTVFSVSAQKVDVFPTRQLSEFAKDTPNYCWYNQLQLDNISQHIPVDKVINVIARRGDKDLNSNLNKRRLSNVQAYLTQAVDEKFRHSSQAIILSEGEPIKGFGQVEFYLGERLIAVLKAKANSDLRVTDCYSSYEIGKPCANKWQKLFYPCKDQVKKKKHKVTRRKNKSL